jgi:hypothetical protein
LNLSPNGASGPVIGCGAPIFSVPLSAYDGGDRATARAANRTDTRGNLRMANLLDGCLASMPTSSIFGVCPGAVKER